MAYSGYSSPPPLDRSDQPGSSGYGGSPVASFQQANPMSGGNQGSDYLQGIYNGWYNTQYLPGQMYSQAQIDMLKNQEDLARLQGGLSSNIANQQAGFSLRDIGISREGLGVQEGALARQMGLLPQQYGLEQQGFGLQESEAQYRAGEQNRSLKGAATAAGNWMLPGAAQGRADIATHLQQAMSGIGLQRQQAELSFKEKQAQQQDASKMLGLQSKRLGLSEEEVRAKLQNSLDQIGISTNVTVDQLLAEMFKVQQGGMSVFEPLFGALAGAQGITIPA